MVSKVIMTRIAQKQLNDHLAYLINQFHSQQAYRAVKEDAKKTRDALLTAADILALCEDPDLAALGYHTIHFRKHQYFFVYVVENDTARIDAVYHDLQDYENLFKANILGT